MIIHKKLFLLVFLFFPGPHCFAQNLYQIVSLNIQQQPLETALSAITKSNKIYFSYSSNYIPKDSIVSINVKNNTVKEVLDILLSEKFEYRESNNYIILRPAPNRLVLVPQEVTDKDNWYTVEGRVMDERTGAKIYQASVYEKRLLSSTLTDRDGYFKLRLRKSENEIALTVSKELYRDVTLVILPSTIVHPGGKEGYSTDDPQKVERTVLGRLFISSRQKIQSLNLSGFFTDRPFQASLTPGLSTHGMFNSQVVNKFSLNLVGGYTTGTEGFEMAGVFNINKQNVSFLQIAGGFNVVGGNLKGVQVAGVSNTVMSKVEGVQIAGVINDVRGSTDGVQIAGVLNKVKQDVDNVQIAGAINSVEGSVKGIQIAGAINTVKDTLEGVEIAGAINQVKGSLSGMQIAGGINKADGDVDGFQLAGGLNLAGKSVKGVQLSSIGNKSGGETKGAQISAIYNYSKKLTGFQLGIFNIADSSSGVSLGLLNIIKTGYHKVAISSNEVMNTNLSFISGNSKFYSIITGSTNISGNNKAYALGLGVGHDFILSKRSIVSATLTLSNVYLGNKKELDYMNRISVVYNFTVLKGISIYAGPAFSLYLKNNKEKIDGYKEITPGNFAFDIDKDVKGWVGFEAGLRLF
jgi:hypothetical protein